MDSTDGITYKVLLGSCKVTLDVNNSKLLKVACSQAVNCIKCKKPVKAGGVLILGDSNHLSCALAITEQSSHVVHDWCRHSDEACCTTEGRSPPKVRAVAIDVGGVICKRAPLGSNEDTLLGENWKHVQPQEGCVEAVALLVKTLGVDNVFILSKASDVMSKRTRAWLDYIGFFRSTGLPSAQVHFVLKREDKAILCQQMKIDCMIDDHIDVLTPFLRNCILSKLVLFDPDPSHQNNAHSYHPSVYIALSWPDVTSLLL